MIRVIAPKNLKEIRQMFSRMNVDEVGIGLMLPKAHHYLLYLDSLGIPAANILKQELLSLGADVALDKGACNFSIDSTPCLMMGTYHQFELLAKKLSAQPFGLKKIGKEIKVVLENTLGVPAPFHAGSFTFDFSKGPFVMGVLNVTPDSFSGDGIHRRTDLALKRVEQFVKDGADILDVGGESTRPGAHPVSLKEEKARVVPVVKAILKRFRIPISVDTTKSDIAEACLAAGAHLINDVSGLLKEPAMAEVAQKYGAAVVVMHHRISGSAIDLMADLGSFFEERLHALTHAGIAREKIMLDPGIGFGKTPEQNLLVLKHLAELKRFGQPLLLGVSRKSFIGKVLGKEVSDRLPGTLASVVYGYLSGAQMFRVHDVREAREALQMSKGIMEAGIPLALAK